LPAQLTTVSQMHAPDAVHVVDWASQPEHGQLPQAVELS
jgi:hypothetical protein